MATGHCDSVGAGCYLEVGCRHPMADAVGLECLGGRAGERAERNPSPDPEQLQEALVCGSGAV